MPVLLLFVLAAVVGCAAHSWIAFALTALGVPAALVLLGSLAERAQQPQHPPLRTLTPRIPQSRSAASGRPAPRPRGLLLTRAERRQARELAAAAERKRQAAVTERLARKYDLPNPTYEKHLAEEQARLRKISEALEGRQ